MSSLRTVDGDIELYDPSDGTALLRQNGDGVEVPNGGLDVNGDVNIGGNDIIASNGILGIGSGGSYLFDTNGSGAEFRFYNDNNDSNVIIRQGGNVEIPNGELTIDSGWRNHINIDWNATWDDIEDTTYRGLSIGGSNSRFFRLGSDADTSADHQHNLVFTRNNEKSDVVFGVTASHDGGSTWKPSFIIDGKEDVEIPNGDLTVSGSLGVEKTTPGYLFEDISDGSVNIESILPAANISGQKRTQATDVVADNSSVIVLDGSNTQLQDSDQSETLRGYLAVVVGQLDGEASPHFTDIINGAFGESIDVISSVSRGTVPTRSYSDGFDLELAIDGSSETYNVAVVALGAGRS